MLTDRLRPFEHAKGAASRKPGKRYELRLRQAAIEGRTQGFAALKAERALEAERSRKWAATRCAFINAGPGGPVRKMLYVNVQTQADAARRANAVSAAAKSKALSGGGALPNRNEWLMRCAEAGDVDALVVPPSRAEREERMRDYQLTAERAERAGRAKAAIMESLRPQARKDGAMPYRTVDGGLVLDRASHMQTATAKAGAALVALSLAAELFAGQALDVCGTEQFRRDGAQLAAMHKIRVTLADSAMETTRRVAETVREAVRPPAKCVWSGALAICGLLANCCVLIAFAKSADCPSSRD